MNGAEQSANAGSEEPAPSIRHWNVAPLDGLPNANDGVGSLVRPSGPASMNVSIEPVSTVNARDGGVGSTLPASSGARTENVYDPAAGCMLEGGAHGFQSNPGSTLHSNVEPGSPRNVKVGVASVVVPLGPPVTSVSASAGEAIATKAIAVAIKVRISGSLRS